MKVIPVILSGGSGTRLWPLSRKHKPKQFLALFGENTMFQETLNRLVGLADLEPPIVVCNNDHRFMVAEQLHALEIDKPTIILEPIGRDTAPALAIAALQAQSEGRDPILLVLAADHVIPDLKAFHQAINQAKQQAEAGLMVTFGIVPTSPNTGYGYIQADEKNTISKVKAFVEKPNLKTAETYVASGDYYWNSGMFMFKASTLLTELERFQPEIINTCRESLAKGQQDLDFIRLDENTFKSCRAISIDYAVMEKTEKAVVVIGGMSLATMMTLFLVPVLYAMLAGFTRPAGSIAKRLTELDRNHPSAHVGAEGHGGGDGTAARETGPGRPLPGPGE